MLSDIDVHGVFVTPLLVWLLLAYGLNAVVRRILASAGFYALVWHRGLFDLALFVINLGVIVTLAAHWTSL